MSRLILTAFAVFFVAGLTPQASHAQQPFTWVQDNVDVYNLQVVRVDGRRLTARVFELEGRRTFRVPSDFRFYIDGQPTDVTALQPRQRLRAYVTRAASGELVLVDAGPPQATPPAAPPAPPVIAVQAPAPAAPAMLPKTASPLPLVGLAGLLALAIAIGARLARRQR